MAALEFWVPGAARTKGSVDVGRHGQVLHTQASKDRAGAIRRAAGTAMAAAGWRMVYGAVSVTHLVWLDGGDPAVDVGAFWTGSGDLDKIERNLWDALTEAHVWVDDVQVVEVIARKHVTSRQVPAGEYVLVRTVGAAAARRWNDESASQRARELVGVGTVAVPEGF